jgi:hypothetical protein
MSIKSRSNYNIKFCTRECSNRNIKCNICIRFNEYEYKRSTEEERQKEST